MTHDCPRCERRFGGTFGFDRHVDRRKDRCRTAAQLRARGLRQRPDGVWVQTSSFFRQLRLWREKTGRKAKDTRRGLYAVPDPPPQSSEGS